MATTSAPAAGYSGTPLAKKLGLREGALVCAVDAPAHYRDLLAPLPENLRWQERADAKTDLVHHFATRRDELADALIHYRHTLGPAAVLWISWPKKTAKVATDLTEDVLRELALPLGLVDVKVCAVDATWSGLKLVLRKELR